MIGDGVDYPYWVLASEIDTLFFAYGEKYDHTIDVDNCTLFALYIVFSFFLSTLTWPCGTLSSNVNFATMIINALSLLLIFLLIYLFEDVDFDFSLDYINKNIRMGGI